MEQRGFKKGLLLFYGPRVQLASRASAGLLEYGLWFFTVARNPSSYYGGLAATAELLGNIASTIDSYLSATVGGRAFKKGGDDGWLRWQPRTARLPRAFTPVHRPLQTFPPLSSTKCAWITLPFS